MSITSGRTIAARYGTRSAYCQGCEMRLLVGEPRASSAWPALLMLTPEQVDVLLMAAAEWDSEEVGGGPSVDFIDWAMACSARARMPFPPDHDGAPPRWEKTGVTAGPHRASHRHPFPVAAGEGDSMRRWTEETAQCPRCLHKWIVTSPSEALAPLLPDAEPVRLLREMAERPCTKRRFGPNNDQTCEESDRQAALLEARSGRPITRPILCERCEARRFLIDTEMDARIGHQVQARGIR